MTDDRSRCAAGNHEIFCALESHLLRKIDGSRFTNRFPAGHVFCEEGDAARAVHCVLEGAVKLVRSGERGDNQVVGLLGPNALFGLRPLLAGDGFAVRAVAIEDSLVCMIPKSTFTGLLRESPPFAFAVMAYLAREIRFAQDLLMALTQRTVKRRVADVLLLLNGYQVEGGDWSPFPQVKLKRREIAEMVSTTPETLSRTLAELAKQKLIHVTRKEIVILDAQGLQQLERFAGST